MAGSAEVWPGAWRIEAQTAGGSQCGRINQRFYRPERWIGTILSSLSSGWLYLLDYTHAGRVDGRVGGRGSFQDLLGVDGPLVFLVVADNHALVL